MHTSFIRWTPIGIGLLVVGLLVASFAQQGRVEAAENVLYVVPGGAGTRDGLSWANAKDLQAAIAAAASGSQVWIKAGTYTPTTREARTESFELKTGVAVYGGFAGTETLLSQRNVAANVTRLSGDIGSVVIDDNSYHVVTSSGNDATALLDGVTISGGNANGASPHDWGGGVFNNGSSPTLRNVTITNNVGDLGGGMFNGGSSPVLRNVTISGNTARHGGGMYTDGSSSPTLTDVTVSGNTADEGGGLYNHPGSNPTLTDVTISGNTASADGGGLYNNGNSATLTDVTISDNTASIDGGGLYNNDSISVNLRNVRISGNTADNGGGMSNSYSSPVLTDVTIINNAGDVGGGMINLGSSPVLRNVIISGNTANYGGGIYNYPASDPSLTDVTISGNTASVDGGGLYNYASNPALRNVIISGNKASEGGGMVNVLGSDPTLTNVTISGNSASVGGAVYNYASDPVVRNSIVWGNHGSVIFNESDSAPNVQYSNIQGGYEGVGNINADPRFVTAVPTTPSTGGDLHLQVGSPAINAGLNAALPADITTDRDGKPRIFDTTVDMGAFERQKLAQTITFAPLAAKTYGNLPFTVSATASSGLPVTFTAAGVCTVGGNTVTLSGAGICTITATQTGDATHELAQVSRSFAVAKAATSTTLRSSLNPSAAGQSVTFTVRVTSPAGTPGGTVNFKDGATVLGTGTLNRGVATFATNTLSVGAHSIVAVFGGSATHAGSQSSLRQVVRHLSTTTVTSSLNPSRYGQSVTFTAKVSSSGGVPSGSVSFLNGRTVLSTRTLSGGQVTFTTATLGVGAPSITARYNGNTVYAPGTSPVLRQSVQRALTTTALRSSLNPSTAGQSVTFTAKVTAASGGTPTGTVTFKDGTTVVATRTLSRSQATLAITTLSAGLHSITAVYNGSTTHFPRTSAVLSQRVRALTTTTVTSSLNPATFGQAVTFTAKVVGGTTPGGTVSFLDGTTVLGTRTMSGGQATLTLATLGAGTHNITARYNGSTTHVPSTSSILRQTINRALTTTTLASSANPATVGQPVTFKAQVIAASGGTAVGTVQFRDGTAVLGTVALVNGKATFTTSTLTVGAHAIRAMFVGSTNFNASASAILRQTIK